MANLDGQVVSLRSSHARTGSADIPVPDGTRPRAWRRRRRLRVVLCERVAGAVSEDGLHAGAAAKPRTDHRDEPPCDSSGRLSETSRVGQRGQPNTQAVAATRRNSTPLMVTPGAAQLLTGGAVSRACSSVSNSTIEKPCPSAGSSQ